MLSLLITVVTVVVLLSFTLPEMDRSDCSSYLLREEERDRRGGRAKRRWVRQCVSFENLISLIKVPTGFTRAHLPSSFFLSFARCYVPFVSRMRAAPAA